MALLPRSPPFAGGSFSFREPQPDGTATLNTATLNTATLNIGIHPWSAALFLIVAFSLAGLAHSYWLRWPGSQRLAIPIDGGRTFRGRRLLGDNKTWRGFAVMVPAAGLAFGLLSLLLETFFGGAAAVGLWPLDPLRYSLLGLWTGFFFMAGELPNSFFKRQLDVAPGEAPKSTWAKVVGFVLDRFDSVIGLLASAAVFVATPWQLWLILLLGGSFVHWLFSVLLYAFGVKKRPA